MHMKRTRNPSVVHGLLGRSSVLPLLHFLIWLYRQEVTPYKVSQFSFRADYSSQSDGQTERSDQDVCQAGRPAHVAAQGYLSKEDVLG